METKNCTKCKETKSVTEFSKDRGKKDGLQAYCKVCNKAIRKTYGKAYHEANREQILARRKTYREANREKLLARNKAYYETIKDDPVFREKERARTKAWRKANPDKVNAKKAKRRGCRLQATPPWLTKDHLTEIHEWYTIAQDLQWLSEERLHVDHIVPLQGKNVCGLHVPWNLQILPESENIRKGNKLIKRYLRKVA